MMLNKYFNRTEFACRCGCGFNTVDAELLEMLTKIREHFGKPVVITSGCRCEAHNRVVGGSDGSLHKLGRAADIVVRGVMPSEVHGYIKAFVKFGGLGKYKNFTHVDSRSDYAEWIDDDCK